MPIAIEELLLAYANGYFPMAEHADAEQVRWYRPELRGIIPLDKFHIPRSLQKFLRKQPYHCTINRSFTEVMQGCAAREDTWINQAIKDAYHTLHIRGFAHSVECWQGEQLVGGLYGVSLGGAFFGESMFSTATNASKAALVHLIAQLRARRFRLLDTQYINAHLLQFGCIEIPHDAYIERLQEALQHTVRFNM